MQRELFLADTSAVSMLEAMPGPAVVLNHHRQIIAMNAQLARFVQGSHEDSTLGQRPGELLECIHANERPGGCGTADACATCGLTNSVLRALATTGRCDGECRISTLGGASSRALDLHVSASHMLFGGESCVVVGLTDVSGEKRRQVLEHVFFHDLLNAIGGVHGLAELLVHEQMDPEEESECKNDIHRLSGGVIDEIRAHREMLAAERGEFVAQLEDVDVRELLNDVARLYRHHEVAADRSIEVVSGEAVVLHTDSALLRRVLGNLIKNALEAIESGSTVTVSIETRDSEHVFLVKNPGVIPREVQLQMFQRSFSTKASAGRGIGTYSARLLTERHLGGRVSFVSNEQEGTVFCVSLARNPLQRAQDRAA